MNLERLKVSIEVYGLKAKAKAKITLMLIGVGLVILGAFNMLAVPVLDAARVAIVPSLGYVGSEGGGVFLLGDVVTMAVGAVIVWLF